MFTNLFESKRMAVARVLFCILAIGTLPGVLSGEWDGSSADGSYTVSSDMTISEVAVEELELVGLETMPTLTATSENKHFLVDGTGRSPTKPTHLILRNLRLFGGQGTNNGPGSILITGVASADIQNCIFEENIASYTPPPDGARWDYYSNGAISFFAPND